MASKNSTQRAQSADAVAGRRDRPWLLPYNRRLRNVISISLRNLSLHTSPSSRRRGQTIDDDAVPNTLVSPAKLVALREKKTLGHSRSSSDLRRVPEDGSYSDVESAKRDTGSPKRNRDSSHAHNVGNGTPRTPPRPSFAKLRRRSTLEWANASPQSRQERLEGLTADRMADAFFSLHTEGVQDPIYVSEVVEHTMNPTFRSIDLDLAAPGTTRLDELTMRVWVKSTKWDNWRQLLEISLKLRELQYLCKHLEDLDRPLPHNAVVFHLPDGVYTTFNSLVEYVPPPMAPLARANSTRRLHTSSFDALLRLSKLDDSIQDALATRKQLAAELEAILQENRTAMTERDRVAEAQDRLKTIEYAKKTVSKQLEKARMQQEEKRKALAGRRDLMATDTKNNKLQGDDMRESRTEIPGRRHTLEQSKKDVQSQRRRICEDLQKVYPIQPIKNKALAFTILDLPLPNSEEIDGSPPETIAAALGHVAHILQLLSFYLGTPLPYPVNPRSSTSTVYDPISLLPSEARKATTADGEKTLRTYPLFSRGVPRFRFEYALFLLNKNIQLMLDMGFGVRVLDIRHTLPNLKYLLYVATAGEGELPARKAGGIRGLMRGAGSESRAASSDSTSSALSGILWHGVRQDDGKGKGAVDSLRRNAGALDKRGKAM